MEDGRLVAIKWAKNYEIDKEWEILKFLDGFFAPKPIFRGKRYFIMELIEAKPLKEYINTDEYYNVLKKSLIASYHLDLEGIFHGQLGRYYHILYNGEDVKFIDFERGIFTKNPRNFLQIIGYYLYRDKRFDKEKLKMITNMYKQNKKSALEMALKLIKTS